MLRRRISIDCALLTIIISKYSARKKTAEDIEKSMIELRSAIDMCKEIGLKLGKKPFRRQLKLNVRKTELPQILHYMS